MRLEWGGHSLQPASLVIQELSFGIQRLADDRRKERFRSYLQNLRRLTGCSCLHANAGSASFKSATGPWLSFALDLSELAINQQEHLPATAADTSALESWTRSVAWYRKFFGV